MMTDIIDKIKQYPIAVICGVLLVLFGVVIFLRDGVAAELSAKETELTSRIKTIEKNKKNANNLDQDTEELSALVDKMNALLFDRNERAINTRFFYEFEDQTGVVVSNIIQVPQEDPIYADKGVRELKLHSTLVFNISLSGSFENVLKFLYEIDRADPLMRVADFQIARGGDESGGPNIDARLRIIVMAKKD